MRLRSVNDYFNCTISRFPGLIIRLFKAIICNSKHCVDSTSNREKGQEERQGNRSNSLIFAQAVVKDKRE